MSDVKLGDRVLCQQEHSLATARFFAGGLSSAISEMAKACAGEMRVGISNLDELSDAGYTVQVTVKLLPPIKESANAR